HPLTNASPTLDPILRRTARMAVRVPLVLSLGLSASIAEIEESSNSDSESDDAEDEGPTTKDEDLTAGDKGLAAGDDGPGIRDESLSLGWDEAVPEGQ
ncbi:hypothetical protein Tco_1497216, partial [Tanacetum coccineum]